MKHFYLVAGILLCSSLAHALEDQQPDTIEGLSKHELHRIVEEQFSGDVQPTMYEKVQRGKQYILKSVYYILASIAYGGPTAEVQDAAKRLHHEVSVTFKSKGEEVAEHLYRRTLLKGYTTTKIVTEFLGQMVDLTSQQGLNMDIDAVRKYLQSQEGDLKLLGKLGTEHSDNFRWMDLKTLEKFLTKNHH